MRETLKSIASLSWAMSLFGVRQLNGLWQRSAADTGPARRAELDAVTRATEAQLQGRFKRSFEAGDGLQRSVVDLAFGIATLEVLETNRLKRLTSDVLQQSTQVVRRLIP